jgi:polysaccharide biosynthesis transport protein
MKELESYNEQNEKQEIEYIESSSEAANETQRVLPSILRRWYIAFLVMFVICGIGLPAIWFLTEPVNVVQGAVRVAPILEDILTNNKDPGQISNYAIFMNTQAAMITSNQVIQRVADNLAGKDLSFFKETKTDLITKLKQEILDTKIVQTDPSWQIKQALFKKKITVAAPPETELIEITMRSYKAEEAKQIVDAFINAYMAVGVSSSTTEEDKTLRILEDERKARLDEISAYREQIYRLAQEYGTDTLSGRQDMMLQRVADLLSRLTEVESQKVNLEARVQLLERTNDESISPDKLMTMRREFINQEPSVIVLSGNIAKLEQELIEAEETLTPDNEDLKLQSKLLEITRTRLTEAKEQASKDFDELLSEEIAKAGDATLMSTRAALEHIKGYEELLQNTIDKEDEETIALGRLQLNIEDLQDKLNMAKNNYDTIVLRIQDLEMQRKRPARISVHYYADIVSIKDNRIGFSVAIVLAAMFLGSWLAFLRDKADLRLRTPEDIAKRIGIRIIGTTTSLNDIKRKHIKEHIIGDYQTIRANLGLIDADGIPKKLVVASPGMKEGKTTFAVNLAMSMAESGRKVLLIDGDLRKPDVSRLLNLPKDTRGLQDILSGVPFDRAVFSVASTGLDVLAADFRDAADACELLSLSTTAQRINEISKNYDNVIIDTPPILAFPDAQIWAKIGDAVILTSFAGQTTLPELREAKERMTQINVRILGTVVSSVEAGHSYYRQDYGSYSRLPAGRSARVKMVYAEEAAKNKN